MCSQRVPNVFPTRSHCDQKASPQALLNVHYVSAKALATFRGGDICLVLVYKATSPVLFGPLFLIVIIEWRFSPKLPWKMAPDLASKLRQIIMQKAIIG
jgi:hypothetical protein